MNLLLLILLWDPVLLNCHGGPETVAAYTVRAQHVRLLGWTNDDPPKPIYSDWAPQQGSTVLTEWWLSGEDLLAGDVAWWELVSVDEAGYTSDEACP